MPRLTRDTERRAKGASDRGRTAGRPTPRRRPPPSPLARTLRRAALATLLVGALVGGSIWAVGGGHVARWTAELRQGALDATVAAGFGVEEVLVQGRDRTPPDRVLDALAVDRADPILLFDPTAARGALETISWIDRAVVQRRLPDTILVTLTEREPLALWQHEQTLRLIDRTGTVLTERDLGSWAGLPLVVGPDAPEHAPALLDRLVEQPVLADRVRAAVRIGDRRWDLHLHNGIVVNLPETDIAGAMARLVRVETAEGLFGRDILSIDLRLPDRLVIRTTPLANERRLLPEEPT